MYQDDPVNKVIRTLVRTMLALPADFVRPANQTGAPAGSQDAPFATVLIITAIPQGRDQRIEKPDPDNPLNLLETLVGMYHVIASVQFFREGATAYARALKGAIETSNGIDYMQAQNIGFIHSGQVQNVTGIADTFFEERATVNLELYVTISTTNSMPTFGTFPITVKTKTDLLTFEVSEP